jgi:hypothetical protein
MRRRSVTWDEQDAYSGWRRLLASFQRAGAVKRVKTRTHRRERREARASIRRGDDA